MNTAASGRFVLRLPPDLHESLRREARQREISLNNLVIERIVSARTPSPPTCDIEPICGHYRQRLEGVVLFGSAARGEQTAASDVDLLIVLETDRRPTRALYRDWDQYLAERMPPSTSPHFVALPEALTHIGSIWLEAAIDGVILFDPRSAISALLRGIRERIAAGEFSRRFSHGHPYWVTRASSESQAQT